MSFQVYTAGDDFFQAIGAQPIVDESEPQGPGKYVVHWQLFDMFASEQDVIDLVEAWLDIAQEESDFVGSVTQVWLQTPPLPDNISIQNVWVEIEITSGDLPAQIPDLSSQAQAFPFLALAFIIGAMLAAAALVVSIGVTIEPQGWRKMTATFGIMMGNDSAALEKIVNEPADPTFGADLAKALPVAAAVAALAYFYSQ